MQVLLMSAYDAASHRQWRRGLTSRLPEVDWTVLELPPRHFAWRVRGNPLSWWNHPDLSRQYDRLLATSMVDLATLRGLNPTLGSTPAVLYCHENQFAYPSRGGQHASVEPQMVQLYAALSAQTVLFNSDFNRRTFLDGAAGLLGRFPDQIPKGVVAAIESRSQVLPVGLDEDLSRAVESPPDGPLRLLWNHRWEYDKGPDGLLAFVRCLGSRGIDFRIDILGQSFRDRPQAIDTLAREFESQIDSFGFEPDRQAYRACLGRADVVVSTARHEFQGLAVLEAVAGGARPLVPDRLAYPEYFDPKWRYASSPHDLEAEAEAMVERLTQIVDLPPPDVSALGWDQLLDRYRAAINHP